MTAPREWLLPLPHSRPLSLNDRMHWRTKAARIRQWRFDAEMLARRATIPELRRFTAVLHYRPRDNRRRDTDNLIASLKPLVDGLIDAGVCVDDDAEHYALTEPVIHPATKGDPASMWLVVRDLGPRLGDRDGGDL